MQPGAFLVKLRSMSLSKKLSALKASQLKYAAFLIGLPSSASKVQLVSAVHERLDAPVPHDRNGRIVSVDMGIKNLGICVLERLQPNSSKGGDMVPVRIVDWKRMDVLNQVLPQTRAAPSSEAKPGSKPQSTRSVVDPAAFRPSNLSKTAVEVALELLHAYNPGHILIERQRFRSGGASAVQEWTLRVNMLESMLWATFETLRGHSGPQGLFPQTHEIDPARVARFWCARPPGYKTTVSRSLWSEIPLPGNNLGELSDRKERKTVDKKEKIALVRKWLSNQQTADVALQFSEEARMVADTFLAGSGRTKQKSSNTSASALGGGTNKLDDLADCLLQGIAWVRWAENQEKLRIMLEEDT